MSLGAGTRLGAYEIVAPLGAGGMGEVYRARDTRLGRDVAIKVLPSALAADPERRSRFETEARAVAALSHPNVLALFDIGDVDGVVFLVMELVDGETLRERVVSAGPLSPARAAAIATQIAHGLAAAHDRGIVHRDLKPENIMLTADGRVKLLDFGLAKRLESADDDPLRTVAAGTQPGVVLGTTGYMAPEQVRGLPTDARSDLFALGAVFYEMLAGRAAFKADSAVETMSAILREDPPDLATLAPSVPPAIARVVARCLEKTPAARFRSAADLAFALEAIGAGSTSSSTGAHVAAAAAPRFTRLTFRNGRVSTARFVPGSSEVVFSAAWEGRPHETYTTRPGSPEARTLGLPPSAVLGVSSNGELALSLGFHYSYFNVVSGDLARASLAGGGVRPLVKNVGHADWSPDGKTMAVVRFVDGMCRLEYPAGTLLHETRDWLTFPRVSPDGATVAFARHPLLGDSGGDICFIDSEGNVRVVLPGMISISGLAWSAAGDEVWCSGIDPQLQNGIWAARPGAAPREVHTSAARVTLCDVAADGRVLVGLGGLRLGISAGLADGAREVDLSWFDGSVPAAFTRDGSQVLFYEGHEAENPRYACFLRGVDGSPAIRLGEGFGSSISPDGEWVLALTMFPTRSLMLYPLGFGEPREISLPGLDRVQWAGHHPDGEHLIAVASPAGNPARYLYLVSIADGASRRVWDQEIVCGLVGGLAISRDGRRVTVQLPTGAHGLVDCTDGSFTPLPALGAIDSPVCFDSTGGALLVLTGRGTERAIERFDIASGARTPWRTLAPADPTGVIYIGSAVVDHSGTRYAYSYLRGATDLYLVEGLG